MNRTTCLFMLAASLTVTSCGKSDETQKVEPTKVGTLKITLTDISGNKLYSGTVEENNGASLSFATSGTVKELFFTTGQKVEKGQLLADIDDSNLRNIHRTAMVALEQARDAHDRMQQLYNKGSLPEIQWVEVQTKLKQAESAEKIAKKNLEDSKLYAPFSGIISDKDIEIGQNVLPGQSIAKLVTIDKVKVKIAVPENEISSIKTGQPISISIPALNDKTFTGIITEKGVSANPLSRSYEIKATIINSQHSVMPGMICNVFINENQSESAIVIPVNAILLDSDNTYFVWTVKNGKAHKQPISTGNILPNGIIVSTGIAPNDEIIIKGQQKVSEGTELSIIN